MRMASEEWVMSGLFLWQTAKRDDDQNEQGQEREEEGRFHTLATILSCGEEQAKLPVSEILGPNGACQSERLNP